MVTVLNYRKSFCNSWYAESMDRVVTSYCLECNWTVQDDWGRRSDAAPWTGFEHTDEQNINMLQ